MTGLEIVVTVLSVAGPAVVAAVGYLWGKLVNHEVRLATVETKQDAIIAHLSADLSEVKVDLKGVSVDVQQIKERLAGME